MELKRINNIGTAVAVPDEVFALDYNEALIHQIVQIYRTYNYKTQVLAASIRGPLHIIKCAEAGADVATCPLSAILDLLKHPLTDSGLEKFLSDAKKFNDVATSKSI